MPAKRRIGKARHLEDYQLWQFIEGQGASRPSSVGYPAPYTGRAFNVLSVCTRPN